MINPEEELENVNIIIDNIDIDNINNEIINNNKIDIIIKEQEKISKIMHYVGFITLIFPLYWNIWLMNWINYRNSPSSNARYYARLSCISLQLHIISLMIGLTLFIYGFSAFGVGLFINLKN
jgi:hypothetical protein